jgi:phage terminase large subunit-like protein
VSPPDDQSMFSRLAAALDDPWRRQARPEQLPPPGDWFGWLLLAGRGFGKTRAGAEWVRTQALASSASRIALVAATAADARDVMVEGESGLLNICGDNFRPDYEPSKRRLTWPNGAIAQIFSSEEPERLRGPQFTHAWCDELCAWSRDSDSWDMLMFGLRLGKHPQVMISTTPKPTKLLRELVKRLDRDFVITRGTTFDNKANLAPNFFSQIVSRYENTRLGRQELNAELLEDVEGALWSLDMIEAARKPKDFHPDLRRIVVAIDPAVSVSETSDATGIVVAGVDVAGHGYVLEDLSGKYSPTEWATKAIAAYRRHKADRIVAEQNQGVALVEHTLRVVDRNIPLKLVHASKGKITRAEPVSALYEQGRVSHVDGFPELEDEMCSFEPGSTKSPDRLDALVWGLTELMVTGSRGPMRISDSVLAKSLQRPTPSVASMPSRFPPGWLR